MDYPGLRAASERELQARGVPMHPYLPLVDARVRKSETEIAARIVVACLFASLAEGVDGPQLVEWARSNALEGAMEEPEWAVLNAPSHSEAVLNECSWSQESLFVLAWSVGLVPALEWPQAECDPEPLLSRIPPSVAFESFATGLRLRSDEEILGALDTYYCLHAAVEHPEIWTDAHASVDDYKPALIVARRQALEWLCSSVGWSEVSLDT